MAMSRLEFKMYNQNDFIKMANAMQKERGITQYSPLTQPDRFEQSFYDVFSSDDQAQKHKTLVDIHAAHGVSIHDF